MHHCTRSVLFLYCISHAFLPLTIAKLSTLTQVQFFWPTLYYYGTVTTTLLLPVFILYTEALAVSCLDHLDYIGIYLDQICSPS